MASMQRFLIDSAGAVKVLGGARFDPTAAIASEWEPFGSYYMLIPAIELVCSTLPDAMPDFLLTCSYHRSV